MSKIISNAGMSEQLDKIKFFENSLKFVRENYLANSKTVNPA